MSTRNRRRAERVEVGMPAQIYTRRGFLEAKVCDLSRTGLRMRIRVAALDLPATSQLPEAAQAVAETLAEDFALDLDYKKLGPLLQRHVTLTRVGLVPDAPLFVEVCCEFDEPLTDDVLAILHQELPEIRTDVEAWTPSPVQVAGAKPGGTLTIRSRDELRERPVKLPVADAPKKPAHAPVRHRYRALVSGTTRNAPPAFFCHTDLVTAVGVRVCVPRPSEAADVRNAMAKLVKAHGSTVDVRILDGSTDVWSGSARVTGVELPRDRHDVMLVTLAYDRPLSMATLRRFGLVAA